MTLSRAYEGPSSKGWDAQLCVRDVYSKQWDWECVNLLPVSGSSQPASSLGGQPVHIYKHVAFRNH